MDLWILARDTRLRCKAIRNAVSDKACKHNVALIIAIIWTTAINVISQLILS